MLRGRCRRAGGRSNHEDHGHSHALCPHPLRHGGAQAGVRRPAISHHGSPAGAGGDGRRHHRLGRGLRPLHHPGDEVGARDLRGPLVHRQGRHRYQRPASRSRPGFPHLRPQRARGLRALRHRHRAVGHRRQTRGPTAVRSARRRTEEGGARLCQPDALRQSGDGRHGSARRGSAPGFKHIKLHEHSVDAVRAAREARDPTSRS